MPSVPFPALLHSEMEGMRRGSFAFLSSFPPDATDFKIDLLFLLLYHSVQGDRLDKTPQSVFLVLGHSSQRIHLALPTQLEGFEQTTHYKSRQLLLLRNASRLPSLYRKFLLTGSQKGKERNERKKIN